MSEQTPTRREVLALGGATLTTALAGCASRREPIVGRGTTDAQATDAASPYTAVYRTAIGSVVLVDLTEGQGTGFVYDNRHVVTNAHVVGREATAQLRFQGGEWRQGAVIGRDAHSDLAVIEVDELPADAPPLPIAAEPATVGQEVVVIGNPFGLGGTVTSGIVSGVNRSIPSPAGFPISDAIQTDAAVNPGNSGGPMMDFAGEVVAVINSGGGEDIAFGISAALTTRVVPELIATGTYDHSFMGVALVSVTPALATANDLPDSQGLLVTRVVANGPSAGVLEGSDDQTVIDGRALPVGGDVLLAIDGRTLTTSEGLGSYLALETRPGDTVELTIRRAGNRRTVTLKLGTQPGGF
jgi:S1-C subfamily serine protease